MPFTPKEAITLVNSGTGYDNSERALATLADGSMALLQWDNADPGDLALFHSDDFGDTWTLVDTFSLTYSAGGLPHSMTIDEDDNLYVVWGSSATQVYYTKLTKGMGYDWTAGSDTQVFNIGTATGIGRVDIEYLGDDAIAFAATVRIGTSVYLYTRILCDDGTTLGAVTNKLLPNATTAGPGVGVSGGSLSIARDAGGPTGGDHKWVALVLSVDDAITELHGFDHDLATGAQNSTKVISSSMWGGTRSQYHCMKVFSNDDNKWVAVANMGTGTAARQWACTFSWSGFLIQPNSNNAGKAMAGVSSATNTAVFAFSDRVISYFTVGTQGNTREIWCVIGRVGTSLVWAPAFKVATVTDVIRDFYCGPNRNADVLRKAPMIFNTWNSGDAIGGRYSIFNTFPVNGPSVIRPTSGGQVNTDRPIIGANMAGGTENPRNKLRVEFATNVGFSTNYRSYTFSDSKYGFNEYSEEQIGNAAALFQGTWYLRLSYIDEYGVGGFAGTVATFTDTHPPTTTDHSPTAAEIVAWDVAGNDFSWVFADTSEGDSQTAYQIQVELNSDGSGLEDTGKITDTDEEASIAIDVGNVGDMLRWRVKVWDESDVEGPWSDYQLVQFNEAPEVTVDTAAIDNPAPLVEWTYGAGTGGAQVKSRVVVTDADQTQVLYDSGVVVNADPEWQIPEPVLTRGNSYDIIVIVYDGDNMEGRGEGDDIPADWEGPTQPSFGVVTRDFNVSGRNLVFWNTDDQDDDFYSWRVYRLNSDEWELVAESFEVDGTPAVMDFLASANNAVSYVVVQVKLLSGAKVESDYSDVVTVVPESDHYWIIDAEYQGAPYEEGPYGATMMLAHVTADDFNDEFEEIIIPLIGRGRRREVGTEYGITGTLTAELRGLGNEEDPRAERLALETLRKENTVAYLRNPFGDVYRVAVGQLSFARMAGVGTLEATTVTIPYSELAE